MIGEVNSPGLLELMANPSLRQGDTAWVGRRMLDKCSDAIVAVSEPVNGLVKI